MRVPVIDKDGKQLMPCTPAKARHLLKAGDAKPKRNKLGIFYIQLTYVVEQPANQPLVVGVDPGSSYEGVSVVGTKDTVLNIMAEAPNHVKAAVETRRTMRRARRHRKCWRRPVRPNRLCHKQRIPPSTRSRWEAKFRIVAQLAKILPLTDAVVEDIKATTHRGTAGAHHGKWNQSFSPVEVGKQHLYYLLQRLGLSLTLRQGYETKALRVQYGLPKTMQKDKQVFNSHCVDSWVLAASVSKANKPTEKRLYYLTQIRLYRRQLHRLQNEKGGDAENRIRKPYGGTRSLDLKRGTLVFHPKYGLSSVGGTLKGKISLNAYKYNKRLTQGAKVSDCQILTYSAVRATFVGCGVVVCRQPVTHCGGSVPSEREGRKQEHNTLSAT